MESPQPVDSFRLYGFAEDGWTLLASVPGSVTSGEVPANFLLYGVSATRSGAESAITVAGDVPCVQVDTTQTPPDVGAGDCSDGTLVRIGQVGIRLILP